MSKNIVRMLIVAALFAWRAVSQPVLIVDSLYSPSINKVKSFSVFVPAHTQPDAKFPVLYLLHGYGGNHTNWSSLTKLRDALTGVPLIVVMPDAENSWYVNSATDARARFEDYLMHDLMSYVEGRYPIDTTRRGIAGLSMGGYGATMLAMKHPRRFRFVASFSGALTWPHFLADTSMLPSSKRIQATLWAAFGSTEHAQRSAYDPFVLFRKLRGDSTTYFAFVVGVQDEFHTLLPSQRMLTDSLRAAGIPYESHETPGRHNWKYWDQELKPMLMRLKEIMKLE